MSPWGPWLPALLLTVPATGACSATEGKPAAAFSLLTLGGGRLRLRDLRGKAVLLSFWSAGCPPCNVEAPHLQALQRKYAGKGLRVVGITPLNDTVSQLHAFVVRRHGISYPTLVDPGDTAAKLYGLQKYPLTVLIDQRGAIRFVQNGFREGDEHHLLRRLATILAK